MNLLVLCEGDAESFDSWSGITKSLVDALRAAGATVRTGDVDLAGADRLLGAALSVAPSRRRWSTRYRLGAAGFRLRSRRAARLLAAARPGVDLIVQVGATFEAEGRGRTPYVLCCDSNIRMAERGAATGQSDAARLDARALDAVARREAPIYRGAAAIFTLSELLRRSFIEDFGIAPARVHAIHAGPNLALDAIAPVPDPAGGHPPTVLFVGRQFRRKGGDVLIAAHRRVRERIPDARLVVVGPPVPARPEPGVTWLGPLDKNTPGGREALVGAYHRASVFCLPTRFEPYGVAFIEAMHFGLPCVGTDAWAVPEMIQDGVTGFTVPVDDVDALADRLLRLLADPIVARAMGAAGRARARGQFTWERVAQRVLRVIEPLVGQTVLAGEA